MSNKWKQGAITLLRKEGGPLDIKNYRPVTLLKTTYKIWAVIITNKFKPCMDLLTCDMQHGYKVK